MRQTFLFTLLAAVSVGRAQTVWHPPNDADLTTWIAQAAPGDILQLASTHPNFTLDKGLTLLGPSFIHGVPFGPLASGSYVAVSVPAGQQARLVGLTLDSAATGYSIAPALLSTTGDVSLESVSVHQGKLTAGPGVVWLQNCTLVGLYGVTATALELQGASCVMSACAVTGGSINLQFGGSAGPAIAQAGGLLVASHVTAVGGAAPIPLGPGQPALLQGSGVAFVTDSSLAGGAGAAPAAGMQGGNAIQTAGSVSVARTTLVDGANALAPSTGYQLAPQMVGMTIAGFPARGQSFTATAKTSGGQLLGIVGGFGNTLQSVPPIVEPLFGTPQNLVTLALAIPVAGVPVTATVAVPNQVSLFGVGVWLQALQLAGSEIRASAVVGGTIR